MEDRRYALYNNLISSGKVTPEQIGSIEEFKNSIKDETSARQFHKNLLGAGFSQDEIGSDDDFFTSIASDFNSSGYQSKMPDRFNIGGKTFSRDETLKPIEDVVPVDAAKTEPVKSKVPIASRVDPNKVYKEMEEKSLDSTFKPLPTNSYENIRENYFSRFSLTDEGIQAQADLSETQKDFADMLATEMKSSPAYNEIISSSAAPTDKDTALQALWAKDYQPILEQKLQPFADEYSQKVFTRYNRAMNADALQLDKANARNSWDSIGSRIDEYESELDSRKGGWKNAGPLTFESNVSRIGREANSKDLAEKQRQVSAARSMMDRSQKMIAAADAESNSGFFEGLGRGLKDEAFNIDNWSMGLKGMVDGQSCLNVLEKYEDGGQLTKEEELLMDAMVSNAATQAYFQSELGRGYKAGSVTGASLPFMVDMMTGVAAVSAGTKASSKGLMKWIAKNYTKNAVQRNVAKGITGLSKGVVDTAIHTASFGMGRVADDYTQREIGNIEFEIEDGPKYAGRSGSESGIGTAAKAVVSTGMETQSELIGNQFAPALNFVGRQVMKLPGVSSIPASNFGKFLKDMYNSASVKGVREFAKRTQFQGPVAEYAEEVYNNLGSVALGDMTPEQLVDLDQNIDTFLGVGVMSAAFGAIGTGSFIREKYKTGKEIKSFEEKMQEHIDFDRLKADLQKQDIIGARDFVKQVIADKSLSPEEKKDELKYIANVLKESAMNSAEIELGKESLSPEDIEENKAVIYSEFEMTRKNLEGKLPKELVRLIDAGNDINAILYTSNLSEEQRDAIVDYQASRNDFEDYLDNVRGKIAEAKESARKEVEGVSNPDMGAVVRVNSNLSPEPIHIVGGNLVFDEEGFVDESKSSDVIFYVDENGTRKMAAPSAFVSLIDMNDTESIASQAEQNAEVQVLESEQAQLPQQQAPVIGDYVMIAGTDIAGVVSRITPDGEAIVSTDTQDYPVSMGDLILNNITDSPIEQPVSDHIVQPVESDPVQEVQPVQEEQSSAIPLGDKGEPMYYKAPMDITISDLNDGTLTPEEVDGFITANKEEANKRFKKLSEKAPKIGTNKLTYLAEKQSWAEKLSDLQVQIDYWDEVDKQMKLLREQPGDKIADEILSMEEPLNGEELAAQSLANGNIKLLNNSFAQETGFGQNEAKKYFGLFAGLNKGGMSIQEAGETIMQTDRENGTNFFDQSDPNAGRDAIINVLSQATTRGDLANIIKNNRAKQAERERNAEYEAYEQWCEDNYHMTTSEFEANEEHLVSLITEKYREFDEINFYGNIADELKTIENDTEREIAETTGSSEILQGEEFISSERIGTDQDEGGSVEASSESSSENGNVFEETTTTTIGGTKNESTETKIGKIYQNREQESITERPSIKNEENIFEYADRLIKSYEIETAEKDVNINPTDAQKEAGNYQKGHVKVDGFDVTIENPKGSVRSGVDAYGQEWSVTMNNTYGYIRGTEGVDGDHIDIFLSDDPTQGNVLVVDQINADGSFDEHKVMYGFSSVDEARSAYLANYSPGWNGLGSITEVSKDEFKKWIDSSHRKTKPFSEYKIARIKSEADFSISHVGSEGVIINEDGTPMTLYHGTLNKNVKSITDLEPGHRRDDGDKASFNGSGVSFSPDESVALDYSGGRMENVYRGNIVLRKPYYSYGIAGMSESEAVEFTEKLKTDGYDGIIVYASPVMRKHGAEPIEVIVFSKDSIIKIDNAKKNINTEESPVSKSLNRLVTDDRYAELKKRMQEKLHGQMNIGIDPEILAIGTEMAVYHIENGARKFTDYAKAMISDLGDSIRPYLKSFYNGARDLPGMESFSNEMDNYSNVSGTDITNFDKSEVVDIFETASNIAKEQEVFLQVKEVHKKHSKAKKIKEKSLPLPENDLFNQITENNGPQRGSETENTDLGENQREETGRVHERGMDSSNAGNNVHDRNGSGGIPESSAESVDSPTKNTHNNRNARGINYAPSSPKARFDANVSAIRLMRNLMQKEITIPTEKDMQTLRKYSGWGGLGTFFNNESSSENKTLRELLEPEEYESAVMSINSAYYTPALVIDSLWDAVDKLGFKGGTILEGSAGIGNIIGSMPDRISSRSSIEAVEIDSISGNILKLLYPDAKVHIQGFENTQIKNGSIDLAITNVPFVTGLHVYDKIDKDLSRKFKNIHDFCIAKNIRKLHEGGIGLFITSSGTLDKSRKLREWIIGQGNSDVIGAFRLNNETFDGTNATSDIIIVRKRIGNEIHKDAIDVLDTSVDRTGEYKTGESKWDKKLGTYVDETKSVVMDYNSHFRQHPEYMGGEMAFAYERGDTFRPGSFGLYPSKGKDQKKMLKAWIENIRPIIGENLNKNIELSSPESTTEKEGTLLLEKGELCVSQHGEAIPIGINKNKVKGHSKSECLTDYNTIKSSLEKVLEYQINNISDKALAPLLNNLNKAYDDFVSKYGRLNRNTSISFLKNDVDFPSIAALEDYRESTSIDGTKTISVKKTNVFNGRVIGFKAEPEPTTIKDGVIASVYKFGAINVSYIADKLGRSEADVKGSILSEGLGFEDPATGKVEVRYEYLSGNVREKLELAKSNNIDGEFSKNIEELEKVIPMDIPSHLIEFSLGSSWVDSELYKSFLADEFGITDSSISHVEGGWILKVNSDKYNEKNRQAGVYSKMFKETVMGDDLVYAALNNRTVAIKKIKKNWDGTTETIVDKEATQSCSTRIMEIKDSFKDWIRGKMQQNEELSEKMMRVYNDRFNAVVPKTIDDMFLPEHFGGSADAINLYPHQKKAVIRGTTEPLMLAHEVGSGKTFTLISTAMEMRRIGTAKKPMIVVQNATVGQFVSETKKLYPNAKVLTISDRDRTSEGRRAFYGKIKYSDWDIIVVPQSTFEMIPDSPERQLSFIRERIEDKMHALEIMQELGADSYAINELSKEIENLNEEFALVSSGEIPKKKDAKGKAKAADNAAVKAQEQLDRRTDDVQYFDDMGIDAILVDEAHEYKRLGFSTAMTRGVKGIDPAGSKKAAGVYLKTRSVLEKNGWKNVVFATGTPISNTAAELWTFMKYLIPKETMIANEIYYFDDFVRNFGSISQSLEFSTSGKFKENTRFASYINKPELIRLWASASDTVLTKDISYVNDKVPQMEQDKAQDIFLPQSDGLIDIMRAVRKRLDDFEKMSGKEKKANSSIPLTMYGIAKRAAIDTRLVDKNAEDNPNSKTNKAVDEIIRSLHETKDYKGTVAIFCDNQRRWDGKTIGFDLFEDIQKKLISKGVPSNQIVVMKSGMSIPAKEKIFADVNAGNVRVIIGNTQTLGTGVNIQERLHTLIHMDAPDRPMDYTQRNGRILRQGNLHKQWNKTVRILRFGVEDSLDVTSYQRLKTKSGFIDSIMDGKSALTNNQENRTLEEEEEGLFDNPVAVLSGSQYALLKNQAEREYRKYANKKAQYEADQIYISNRLRRNSGIIKSNLSIISERKQRLDLLDSLFPKGDVDTVTISGTKCTTNAEIDSAIRELVNKPINEKVDNARKKPSFSEETVTVNVLLDKVPVSINVRISRESIYDNKLKSFRIVMHKDVSYSSNKLGLEKIPVSGGYVSNALSDLLENVIPGRDDKESIEALEKANGKLKGEIKLLNERDGKPFEFDKELKAAQVQVKEYTELMQKELQEKEAKYANRGSDDASVNLDQESQDDGENDLRLREDKKSEDHLFDSTNYVSVKSAVKDLSSSLKVPVELISSLSEVQDELMKRAIESGRNIKGWFDLNTNQVFVYYPHIRGVNDAKETVLHETIAHYGLRKLFKEDFEVFLDNIYSNVSDTIRQRIDRMGNDKRIATEEYLAELAERDFNNDEEHSLWQKIKDVFIDMLRKAGINLGFKLSDNELRYILWKSYQNLQKDNVFDLARDISMQYSLGVGEYRLKEDKDEIEEKESDGSREMYEDSLKGNKYKFQEAYQDSMLALKKLQDVVAKVSGKPIQAFENAYIAENQMSSKSTAEAEKYYNDFFEPLEKEIARLMKEGASYEEISDYLILKHGIERNIEFSVRDALNEMEKERSKEIVENASNEFENQKSVLKNKYLKNEIDSRKYFDKLEKIGTDLFGTIYDYSATTTLLGKMTGRKMPEGAKEKEHTMYYIQFFTEEYGENANVQKIACDKVYDFEKRFNTANLWNKINAATKYSLSKSYQSGLISIETYERTKNMFHFYVPLRGWNEKTANDVYEYLSSETSPVNSVLISAKGRESIPDTPIPVIGNMAESTILQGNRNLMKQAFMSMVINHPTDVAKPRKVWYVLDQISNEWVLSFPNIEETDSIEAINRKMEDHEEIMRYLKNEGKATQEAQGLCINYKIKKEQKKEHIITVKRNGKDYMILINGNPRAAQAINGMTNPDVEVHPIIKGIGVANRWLAANFTTRNPAFVLSNLSRDLIFAQSAVLVKESPEYAGRFFRNAPKAMSAIMRNMQGKGSDSKDIDKYFKEFIENGGETGYMTLTDVDKYKKKIKADLDRLNKEDHKAKQTLRWSVDRMEDFNRWAEDVSRFTTYMTSRQMGRSVVESISDAKEVTVNFNKKGAGFKTSGLFGVSGGIIRNLYLFFNAGVQSLMNFGRLAKANPTKFGIMLGAFTSAGFVIPALVNPFLIAVLGYDGDDDPYNDLPDWIRRNNMCLYRGRGQFITIPLPIELRAFYGIGDMVYQYTTQKSKISPSSLAYDAANQLTELLPLNPLGNNGDMVSTLMPDALKPFRHISQNQDFTGKPVYKETPFNELDPDFKRVYKGTSGWLVDSSQFLNEVSGGSDFRKGLIDINPAQVEHIFEYYFGGMGKTFNQLGKTLWYSGKSIINKEKDENLQLRNTPVINRFLTEIDERSAFAGINKEYYSLVDEFEKMDHEFNGLSNKASLMIPKYLNEFTKLTKSKEFIRYKEFERLKSNIDRMYQMAKTIPDDESRSEIEKNIMQLKREAIAIMEESSKSTTTYR